MSAVPVIAIVDDDAAVREALDDLIQSFGCRSTLFASAEDFLDAPDRHRIDCMIVDIRMPGLSGLELQDRLSREGNMPPIIFMTSYDDDKIRAKALAGGAHGFLGKPVDDETLLRCVKEVLHRDA